ncbi:hypothetical protein N7475_003450 [Penicillium sp. IBT 31633x]|nr:hypothetical protein N7475_003450 [Penicillium sp. IBT 31633x]
MSICKHENRQSVDSLLNGTLRAYRVGEKASSISFTCDRCFTQALVEILEHKNQLALVITKWISLGAGLTPDDPQWQMHQSYRSGTMIHSSPDRQCNGEASAVKASSRACFEGAPVDSLRSRNITYLEDQRFKKSMIYRPCSYFGPTWYLYSKPR